MIFVYPFNKTNKVCVCVCKDATFVIRANTEADVPKEENMAGVGAIIQLVLGEMSVLYAYIIQGERELATPPFSLHDNALAGTGRLPFCYDHRVFHHTFKNLCSNKSAGCTSGQKSSLWGCCLSAGSPLHSAARLLQGSFQCMEPDGEQRTQRGLGTAMYCSARSSAMHTHSLPFLLCLWQSLNLSRAFSRPLSPILISFVMPFSPHFLLIAFVLSVHIFSPQSYNWLLSKCPKPSPGFFISTRLLSLSLTHTGRSTFTQRQHKTSHNLSLEKMTEWSLPAFGEATNTHTVLRHSTVFITLSFQHPHEVILTFSICTITICATWTHNFSLFPAFFQYLFSSWQEKFEDSL